MKNILLLLLTALTSTAPAQIYRERLGFDLESIAHIDIGWTKVYSHTTPPQGKQLGNRTYSAKQIGDCQQLVEWMQQSYLPKGCLGEATYYQNYIPKFSSTNSLLGNAINEHAHALPLMYGARSKIYMYLKKDGQGKFVPQNSLGDFWHIEANQLQHITEPVSFISSAEEYYFLLPDYSNNSNGYDADDRASSDLSGFDNHKNIKEYKHYLAPSKPHVSNHQYVVIMTKDNAELPFETITIGEFFTKAEKQLPVWQKIGSITADNYATAQRNLAKLKEKYKNKWNDIAELQLDRSQITFSTFVNATEGRDYFFDNKDGQTTFPILKVKKTARELCKRDQPQWLVIRWSLGMQNQPYFLHLHESILNNLNFDYVYNYFFNPDKVKGQAYKPLRSPSFKEAVVATQASETSRKNAADATVFFFDDFSTTASGKKPIGWQATLANAGTTGVVAHPDGLDGAWVLLRGHYIKATDLKKPLPQDFTLTYDVAVPQNFTWGAKGLTMQLAKETSPGNAESFLKLRLRPGFDGRDGEATLETKFPAPPGYANETKWYVANGFSNNKKTNRIHVTIKKAEENLQVFIDKTKIAEYNKGLPAAHLFNALSFDCSGNSAETDKYYISNIKITKE